MSLDTLLVRAFEVSCFPAPLNTFFFCDFKVHS